MQSGSPYCKQLFLFIVLHFVVVNVAIQVEDPLLPIEKHLFDIS